MTTTSGETSGLGSLAWKWRWVLLVAVIVSSGVGVLFALQAPPEYTSQAEVLIPASDPVTTRTTQVSAITIQLRDYAQRGLGDTVRAALGTEASALQSVTAVQDRTEDIYVITADASDGSVAERAAAGAAEALIGRSNDLAQQQVERLKQEAAVEGRTLTEQLVALDARHRRLVAEIVATRQRLKAQAAAPPGGDGTAQASSSRLKRLRAERSRLESRMGLVDSRRDALGTLGEQAHERYLERKAASTLVTPPSAAASTVRTRLVSTVGLALLAGLAVAFMTILAIEELGRRRRRRAGIMPSRPPREQRGLVVDRSDVHTP